jgi:type 1 fimbriae regulatory protein FimB/type 1 fimbriae regulatory protein FimE
MPPPRQPNAVRRPREYLTPVEVTALIAAAIVSARTRRYGHRDATLILLAYRHGLRVSELVGLHWAHVDFKSGSLLVQRVKGGRALMHPLNGSELRALRQLKRDWPNDAYLFLSHRGGPLTTATVRKMVARAGERASLPFPVHPHMLSHACGYKLVNDGKDTRSIQDYLGHINIRHTQRYTTLHVNRFRDFFGD